MPSHPTLRLTSCMVFTHLFLCICKQQSNHRNECLIPTCSTPAVGICGICCETGDCFMFTVPFRSAAIITANTLPGTTVISDQWSAYNTRNDSHDCQPIYFANPNSGTHMQNIEK